MRQKSLMFSGYEWIAEGSDENKISPGRNYFHVPTIMYGLMKTVTCICESQKEKANGIVLK